jgi:hypothetical protein
MAPKPKADPFAAHHPREKGYSGFTAAVRKIHDIELMSERRRAEVESVFPGLFAELASLEKAKSEASSEFKKGIPEEIINAQREQKQIILATKTALVEVEAAIQIKERKPTLNQIADERKAALIEALGEKITESVLNIENAVIEQNTKIEIALKEARTIDRETGKVESMRTAGVIDLITKAVNWLGGKVMSLVKAVRSATKVVKREGTSIEKNCELALKELASSSTSKAAGSHGKARSRFAASTGTGALDPRKAMMYFDISCEDYNIEEDAENGEPLAMKIMEDERGLVLHKLEGDAYKAVEKLFRVRLSNEGHDSSGNLVCKFPIDSVEDVENALKVINRNHIGGDDQIDTGVQYFTAQGFTLYPQGVNGPRYSENSQDDGTLEEWLEENS